jgi:rifampicin phosphotransferase
MVMTGAERFVEDRLVVGLGTSRDTNKVGMKAAHLAHLSASGFRVPNGFVITTTACDRIVSTPDMPDEVEVEIRSHLDQLGEGPVAVRSSGTAEDLPDASYAGQYETVLGVRGQDAVADAIALCLASATSDQVRAYRRSDARARMAVLVQRMVPAEAAGVAFTANPVSGDNEVLVSAVKGLGDRLVSGEATPDDWVIRGHDVTCLRSPEGALDHEQAREIAELAKAVEQLFGSPQDIEWALADGQVFVLQARAITALPVAPDLDLPSEGFWSKDTGHFPLPLTPFGASVYLPAYSDAMPPGAELGGMTAGLEQRSLGGEVYARRIPVGGKDRPAPPWWVTWLAFRVTPQGRRRARAARTALASGLPQRILEHWEGEWRPAFASEFRQLQGVDLESLGDEALLEHLDRAKDMLRRGADLHFRLVAPYALGLYQLAEVCQELLGWDAVQALALLSGTSVASSEPGRELRALAQRIAADPAALQALTEPGGERLAGLRRSAPWAAEALDDYLERYGHRTVNYDPGEPTWFERPETVARLVAEQAGRAGVDPDQMGGQPDALAEARAELAGRNQEDRARFEATLAYAGRAYAHREDNIVWLDNQPSALLRYCAVEIGRRLVERGDLTREADAVFLEEPELRAALTRADKEDLRGLVARRKAERAWVSAHPGPPSYGPRPGRPPEQSALPPALRLVNAALAHMMQLGPTRSTREAASNELRGVPGSPGHHSGAVRVVRDESEFAKLGQGDVLVAPVTSPQWSVLFLKAGAVVTDGGGMLSHTAVVAREYGIPAVLATHEATRRLRDGDLVSVDGTVGIVWIGPQQLAP